LVFLTTLPLLVLTILFQDLFRVVPVVAVLVGEIPTPVLPVVLLVVLSAAFPVRFVVPSATVSAVAEPSVLATAIPTELVYRLDLSTLAASLLGH
jgi:hypothetical protein